MRIVFGKKKVRVVLYGVFGEVFFSKNCVWMSANGSGRVGYKTNAGRGGLRWVECERLLTRDPRIISSAPFCTKQWAIKLSHLHKFQSISLKFKGVNMRF